MGLNQRHRTGSILDGYFIKYGLSFGGKMSTKSVFRLSEVVMKRE